MTTALATPFQVASADTRAIAALIVKHKTENVPLVTYDAITAMLGYDARSVKGRARTQTARRIVRRENRIILRAVANRGYEIVPDSGKTAISKSYLSRAHSAAREGMKTLGATEFAGLDNAQKTEFNAALSQLGVVSELSAAKATTKIAAKVAETQLALPVAQTLAAFTNGNSSAAT